MSDGRGALAVPPRGRSRKRRPLNRHGCADQAHQFLCKRIQIHCILPVVHEQQAQRVSVAISLISSPEPQCAALLESAIQSPIPNVVSSVFRLAVSCTFRARIYRSSVRRPATPGTSRRSRSLLSGFRTNGTEAHFQGLNRVFLAPFVQDRFFARKRGVGERSLG